MYGVGLPTLVFIAVLATYCCLHIRRRKKLSNNDVASDDLNTALSLRERTILLSDDATDDDVTPRSIGIQVIGEDIDNAVVIDQTDSSSDSEASSSWLYRYRWRNGAAGNSSSDTRQRVIVANYQPVQTTEC